MSALELTHLFLLKKNILTFDPFSPPWNTILQYSTETVFKMVAFRIGQKKKELWVALSVTYLHHVQCNAQGGMDSKNF